MWDNLTLPLLSSSIPFRSRSRRPLFSASSPVAQTRERDKRNRNLSSATTHQSPAPKELDQSSLGRTKIEEGGTAGGRKGGPPYCTGLHSAVSLCVCMWIMDGSELNKHKPALVKYRTVRYMPHPAAAGNLFFPAGADGVNKAHPNLQGR